MNTTPGARRILTASRKRDAATSEKEAALNPLSCSISRSNSSDNRKPRARVATFYLLCTV